MYNKLLISEGGGIVSRKQQAEQDNCATLAIGLGGTGIACLRAFKKAVYNRVAPDDARDYVPRYSHIQFLAVDTDKSSLGATEAVDALDEATEFFDLSSRNIAGGGVPAFHAKAGTGGVRQIGRLLLLQNCTAFLNKLCRCITDARRGEGIYDKLISNMDELKKRGLIFGASVTVTTKNVREVTSDDFLN